MKNGRWKDYDPASEDEYDTIDGDGELLSTGSNANNYHKLERPICAVSLVFKVLDWETTIDGTLDPNVQLNDEVPCT